MFFHKFRDLTSFRGFSSDHARISNGISARVSTEVLILNNVFTNAFMIPFRNWDQDWDSPLILSMDRDLSSPLIQRCSPRRNSNVFPSVMPWNLDLLSCFTTNLSLLHVSFTRLTEKMAVTTRGPIHQIPKPFCITPRHQENLALRENYASGL